MQVGVRNVLAATGPQFQPMLKPSGENVSSSHCLTRDRSRRVAASPASLISNTVSLC
jgi:hypothetical protein